MVNEAPELDESRDRAWAYFRARDLLLLPGLLSLSRIPLAICFPFLVGRPLAALALFLVAGLTDVLDGWVARRYGLVTAVGAALDAVTDKLFVLTVAVTLVVSGRLSFGSVLLMSTRELGEAPLVLWFLVSHHARGTRAQYPSANVPGKVATLFQFIVLGWALFGGPGLGWCIWATAIAGALAAASYWRRALRLPQREGAFRARPAQDPSG